MATQFQIWQHTSGDRYAVLCDDSTVVAALGPLNDAELAEVKPSIVRVNSDPDDAAWVQEQRESFRLVETRRGGWTNPASADNRRRAAVPNAGRPYEKATFRRGELLTIERIPLAPGPDTPIPPAEAGRVLSVAADEIEIQIGDDILTIRRESAT